MRYFYVISFFTLVLATGCIKSELPSAFEGEFGGEKNNKVISEYCTSCHIHKEFPSKGHVQKIRLKYKRKLFRKAKECRVCHYIEKELNDAMYHIERNGNPKIILLDLSMKLTRFLHKKEKTI